MKENYICIARKAFFSCGVERKEQGNCGYSNCGYNYTFEVFIYGPINPVTGLVINLTEVNIALQKITQKLDQKHLNYDISELKKYDIINIHQFIHKFFELEFGKLEAKDIEVIKTTLTEGLQGTSTIISDLGLKLLI